MFTSYYLVYGSTLHFLVRDLKVLQNVSAQNVHLVFLAFVQLLYPLGGYLGDVKYGRYSFIKGSLVFLMVVSVMITIVGCLDSVVLHHPGAFIKDRGTVVILAVFSFLILLSVFGFVGFFANVLPFGIDQLRDAPVEQSWLFIYLYVWTINVCFVFTQILFKLFSMKVVYFGLTSTIQLVSKQ